MIERRLRAGRIAQELRETADLARLTGDAHGNGPS